MIDLQRLQQAITNKRGEKSLRTVSKEVGISHTTLGRIERGQIPTVDVYARLCRWLGVSLDDFVNS